MDEPSTEPSADADTAEQPATRRRERRREAASPLGPPGVDRPRRDPGRPRDRLGRRHQLGRRGPQRAAGRRRRRAACPRPSSTSQVKALAEDFEAAPVEIVADDPDGGSEPDTYTTTAGELGLMVDQDRTVADALEVGDDAFFLLRPFEWVGSFLVRARCPRRPTGSATTRWPAPRSPSRARTACPPPSPPWSWSTASFQVVPGKAGTGHRPGRRGRRPARTRPARGAATAPIRVEVTRDSLPPLGDDAAAEQAAAGLEALVKDPVTITTSGGKRTIPADDRPHLGRRSARPPTARWPPTSTPPRSTRTCRPPSPTSPAAPSTPTSPSRTACR